MALENAPRLSDEMSRATAKRRGDRYSVQNDNETQREIARRRALAKINGRRGKK